MSAVTSAISVIILCLCMHYRANGVCHGILTMTACLYRSLVERVRHERRLPIDPRYSL